MTRGEDDQWRCPDWYPLIRAARYMNSRPWDLLEDKQAAMVPRRFWLLWARIAETAENEAQAQAQRDAQRK